MTTLRDLLGPAPRIVQVSSDVTVRAAAKAMARDNVGCVVILDGGRMVGLFTERDVLKRVLSKDLDIDQVRVREVMTQAIITSGPEQSAEEGRACVRRHNIRHLPVVEEDGRLLGVLSLRDLLRDEAAEARHLVEEVHRFLHGEVFEGPH